MKTDFVVLTDAVLITCIVQRGVADVVVEAALKVGAQGATVFYARGTGVRQHLLGVLGVTVNTEKEVIYIVAPSEQADLIFERVFVAAKLDTPAMGMIYMSPLEKLATYVPPAVVERFLGD
ncbi:MAG: transcriptional regulator [Betaproteobacteria bacterium RIFCSPLOWO2_02_67_12]|nr:MAG: transcriptional regulator [Betaproteobacteria bacterium RIFCSPLOWO2_02_67_12]HLE66303.1 P-II family nitrogen regulator [Burkholderiales bacterium]